MNIIAKTFFVTTVLIVIAPFVRANDEIAVSKTDIADKYYRQALFYFFIASRIYKNLFVKH